MAYQESHDRNPPAAELRRYQGKNQSTRKLGAEHIALGSVNMDGKYRIRDNSYTWQRVPTVSSPASRVSLRLTSG